MVVPAAGGTPRQVSFVANSFFGSLDWSAKGDYIVYRTAQRTEPGRLVKIDMVPLPPTFDEAALRELFNEPRDTTQETPPDSARAPSRGQAGAPAGRDSAAGAADAPDRIEIVFDGIRRRGAFIDTDFSVGQMLLS